MQKDLNIELELRENYVDSDVTESIVRYVHAHGFDANNIDELLLGLGYDEIFKEVDEAYHLRYDKITSQVQPSS
ncbi:MAG: hypothetical protein DSZ11_02420 [Sulfurovum sp.]|nr:MAG: hypothetical protein DSZ11_02420 [Sulfurovum sp.]